MKILKMKNRHNKIPNNRQERNKKREKNVAHYQHKLCKRLRYNDKCGTKLSRENRKRQGQICAKEAKNRNAISAQSFPLMKFSHLPPSCQNKGLWVGCEWNYTDFIFLPRQN